jgi:carboxyl-terminal processing protease
MYFRNCIFPGLLFFLHATLLVAQQGDRHRAEMAKNLDIYHSLIKELDVFYVDSIHPDKLIPEGIELMLSKLDPYTVFYVSEKELNDFMFQVTGEYGGIGSIINERKGKTYISEPYEALPADLAGLKAGDEILSIDDIPIEQIEKPTEKLKGPPNTKVKVKYLRPGAKKPVTVEILRKRIQLNPVTYYGTVGNNTGYIYLSGFTDQCAQQVKLAFDDLKKNHAISSLILDLRDNAGGSMEEAIQIVNIFVPKGKVVLSTKGKRKQWDRTYRTTLDAMDENIPLAVLVNESSASASEIVSGAIQDLDRGVLVGRRTYGKGLVQTTRELPYNTGLKLTTSKYYIPSGRCIQAVDYSHRAPDGSVSLIPDSLTSLFHTENGRPVRDGGGVTPDITPEEQRKPSIIYYLLAEYIIFDYVTQWVQLHRTIPPVKDFVFPDEDYESFKAFVKSKNFVYDRQSEKAVEKLKEIMDFEGYLKSASEELKALEAKLHPDLDRDLEINKASIVQCISQETVKRYYYQKGEIVQLLKSDDDLKAALDVLQNKEAYHKLLSAPQQ